MSAKRTVFSNLGCGRQHGAALMVMLVILVIGAAAILVGVLGSSSLQIERDKTTADALARAKDALLGYAVSDNNRPGELPCPDIDNDGMVTLADYSGSNCQSLIGRLPWKTLGIPDLRDGSGERLWYAISDPFHANGTAILNSNTKGTLLVYNADGTTLKTQSNYSAVAVIFAPGSPVGTQQRNTVAQQNNAANYLDTANSRNNATAGGPFIAGAKTNTFNDQLMIITTQNLIPLVEQRVAGEVKKALTNYYAANGYYPWPDDITASADYDANSGINRGWLPYHTAPGSIPEWCCTAFPAWFYSNQWYTLIYYSVAEKYSPDPADFGTWHDHTLTVDSTTGVRALFFMPGTFNGTTRSLTSLPDYLEDAQNNDNSNDLYVTPTSQAFDRDRLYWLSSSSTWNQ